MILFWHDVADNASEEVEGESFPVKLFEKQITYLIKHYEIISIDEFYKRYKSNSFTNKEIIITFDDGYRNNLYVAAPILKKYNLPFTVFVSANNVEEQKRFYVSIPRLVIIGASLEKVNIPLIGYSRECKTKSERIECANEVEYKIKYLSHDAAVAVSEHLISLIGQQQFLNICKEYPNGNLLTWDDVIKLSRDYDCTIGSHCLDHCICHPTQDKDLVAKQVIESKNLIENRTGLKCDYFAYPNGDYTEYSNMIVASYYKMGFSTERLPASKSKSIASIGRIGVPRSMIIFKYALTIGAKNYR